MERQCKANVIIQQADGHRIPIGKLIHCLTSLTQQHRTTVDALMQSESASGSAASASATTATANGSSAASDSTAQRQQQICRKTAALLQEQRLRHIQRFLETEAALNSAHQLNVRCRRRRCHSRSRSCFLSHPLYRRQAEYNKACEHLSTLLRVNDTNQDRVLSTSAANLIIHAQETMQLLVSESRLAGETASLATLQKLTEQIATAVQTQSAAIVRCASTRCIDRAVLLIDCRHQLSLLCVRVCHRKRSRRNTSRSKLSRPPRFVVVVVVFRSLSTKQPSSELVVTVCACVRRFETSNAWTRSTARISDASKTCCSCVPSRRRSSSTN